MKRVVTRVINRVLMGEPFARPMMGVEAKIDTQGRRKLVVGLGNPGMEETRHSVGMVVLGALAARLDVSDRWCDDPHVSGEVILSEVQDTQVVLLRPRLQMNVNGVCVAKAARKYGVKPEDILLVHDELVKPLGKVAVKHGGSTGGHYGVRSCVDCLQTDAMPRLRVGIGRPSGETSVKLHLQNSFTSEERRILDSVLVRSVDLVVSQLLPAESRQDPRPSSSPAGGKRAAPRRKRREASPEDTAAAPS